MSMVKKSNVNKLVATGKLGDIMTKKATHKVQFNNYQSILEELKKREPYIDFKTEVMPNLSERQQYVFQNYMICPTGERYKDIAKVIGLSCEGSISRVVDSIFNAIDNMIKKKEQNKNYIESLGGEEVLEDLKTFLSPKENEVLNEVILGLRFNAATKYDEKHKNDADYKDTFGIVKKIKYRFDNVLERKKEVEEFTQSNGGEDFLINEFGMTLSEDQFFVLINFLMDYHYLNDHDASLAMGRTYNYLCIAKQSILEKLEYYKKRKSEVDERIERAGGTEKVVNELYMKLSPNEKRVFEEMILRYVDRKSYENLSIELHTSKPKIKDMERKLNKKLDEMTEANVKEKK